MKKFLFLMMLMALTVIGCGKEKDKTAHKLNFFFTINSPFRNHYSIFFVDLINWIYLN